MNIPIFGGPMDGEFAFASDTDDPLHTIRLTMTSMPPHKEGMDDTLPPPQYHVGIYQLTTNPKNGLEYAWKGYDKP